MSDSRQPITPQLLRRLQEAVGANSVAVDAEALDLYGRDKTRDLFFPPEAVVLARDTAAIRETLRIALDAGVPVTPRGAGTGLSGGALPLEGGIVLSTEPMRRILDLDEKNRMVVAEPGVVTGEINLAAEPLGLFYPPDPSSLDSCTLAGNVAENAGGPRAVKYGVTGHFLTGAEAVLPDETASVLRLGGKLRKNVTGLNLLGLMLGSEGTLGVFSELTFRLIPMPRFREVYLAEFVNPEDACRAVSRILLTGVVPSAMELMSRAAIEVSHAQLELDPPTGDFGARLLFEVDGDREEELARARDVIGEACLAEGAEDLFVADTSAKQEQVWKIRRTIGEAVKSRSVYEEEDIVVPTAAMGLFFREAESMLARHGLDVVMYGHAGDGNIHCNILQGRHTVESWEAALGPATAELFAFVKKLGGTLTGEHGVGLIHRKDFRAFVGETEYGLTRGIKNLIDPRGLLNPGKII